MSGTSKFLENLDVPDIFFLFIFYPINTVFPLPDVTKETNS